MINTAILFRASRSKRTRLASLGTG